MRFNFQTKASIDDMTLLRLDDDKKSAVISPQNGKHRACVEVGKFQELNSSIT